jgi:hypothetical protein
MILVEVETLDAIAQKRSVSTRFCGKSSNSSRARIRALHPLRPCCCVRALGMPLVRRRKSLNHNAAETPVKGESVG